MAQSKKQLDIQKIRICAELSKFAYTSGDPELKISTDDELAKQTLSTQLAKFGSRPEIQDFYRFHTKPWLPWFIPWQDKFKWFRSYAYSCHYKTPENVDRIVVGFRGTWANTSGTGKWFEEDESGIERRSYSSRLAHGIMNRLAPSNFSYSDFAYDATLIRVPYRPGAVWKWWSYWGSLILERSPKFLGWPRTVAVDWMSRGSLPDDSESTTASRSDEPLIPVAGRSEESHNNVADRGNVHLGFWSLWSSPEGFARYDTDGKLLNDNSVLKKVTEALEKTKNNETEVFVVGHSLGGAVSCFAALEIAEKLKDYPKATMYHVTFGAPPVGTTAFAEHFDKIIHPHCSLSISHSRDMIPHCFSWCASKGYLRWLHWWGNWSCVGEKCIITKTNGHDAPVSKETNGTSFINKCKWALIGGGTLMTLFFTSVLAVPISAVCYLSYRKYYKGKPNPTADYNKSQREPAPELANEVGLEYHSLQKYIELLENETVLAIADSGDVNTGSS